MIGRFLAFATLVVAAAGVALPAPDGPYEVKTVAFRGLRDADRDNRSAPIKVHYPDADGPFPLVAMSHGGMGTWDAHLDDAQYLARHGYVALCLEHVYSNNVKTKEHARRATGTLRERFKVALQKITLDPKAVLQRPRDVTFAIDRAIEWNRSHPQLRGKIDTDKIAVLGHSYGAYTTLVVCGARPILDHLDPPVAPGKGLAGDLSDPRVRVGIAFSPQGLGTSRFGPDSYKTIDRPLLCFSGTKDTQWGHAGTVLPAAGRLKSFELMPAGDKHLLWLENADHLAFADNPKAHLLPSVARTDTRRIVKPIMLAFLDSRLKGRKAAEAHLTEAYANSLCGKVVTRVAWYRK